MGPHLHGFQHQAPNKQWEGRIAGNHQLVNQNRTFRGLQKQNGPRSTGRPLRQKHSPTPQVTYKHQEKEKLPPEHSDAPVTLDVSDAAATAYASR